MMVSVPNPPDWVLLQYNPFSYGRWGLNLHLPETLRRLRRVAPGLKLAVMVHEPFVPIITPQFAVMATWQRWQLWRLGTSADLLFFSIDPWARRFQKWFPRKPVVHLPVGSNIPRVPITRLEARARLGIPEETIVLGVFGSAHASRLLEPIRSAAEAIQQAGLSVQILSIGPQGQAMCEAMAGLPVIADGPLLAEEVSRRLAAVDIYLAAYVDGVSTRRGAFLTALQHGLAIAGTQGLSTDPLLEQEDEHAFLLADAADVESFQAHVLHLAKNPVRRAQIGAAGQQLYQRRFTWPCIAGTLLTAFDDYSDKRI